MKIILIMLVAFLMVSCNKKQENSGNITNKARKKITKTVKTIKKNHKKPQKEFNIEKNCAVCHNLPKFSEREKDYLSQKLDLHRKLRRIVVDDKEFDKLKARILKKAKKVESDIKK